MAASGRFTGNGLLQPLAATRSHSSGRKWPQVAASGRSMAASGRFRPNQFPPSKQPLKVPGNLCRILIFFFTWTYGCLWLVSFRSPNLPIFCSVFVICLLQVVADRPFATPVLQLGLLGAKSAPFRSRASDPLQAQGPRIACF